ncbi:dienelactone hydrolase family protein [Bradyrhizobium sp. BWA-3-5]|uniref:dienelactone hydrolase family protein n=1 Tax=Bradyrhizobium sp. BWA-3-5 TaxID=3080013 RepID=UPI00293E73B6|nr:dienelactone hydrolase family protein [Bradyrhizobium sp. BWA-3-5]WOH63200.1 dienelactone hydrolase family protein [Bradyrhizobium sp. BWA-3-5]
MAVRPIQLVVLLMLAILPAPAAFAAPDTVFFPSAEGSTEIVAYLFKPRTAGPHPAIVMLHGRGGAYSANVNEDCTLVSRTSRSACNAGSLSKRHMMWGQYWAERGYLALLPDSFGPRGKAHGFGRFTHNDPDRADVNEKTVRPLDAEGALNWLRNQRDVISHRIFLQGWSNGGSTALNVMHRQGTKTSGYRAALALYPGCGPKALLAPDLAASAPITLLLGSDDEEVSPARCQSMAERSVAAGSKIDVILYPGATHGFDDPGRQRQSIPGNRSALQDAMKRAIAFVERLRN